MRYFLVIALLLASFLVNATSSQKENESGKYLLFEKEGKQGLKDTNGKVIIPATYETIGWSRGDLQVVKGAIGYQANGLWGLLSIENEKITKPKFTQLFSGGHQLLVAAKQNDHLKRDYLGVISSKGQTIIPFSYADIRVAGLRIIAGKKNGSTYSYGLLDLSNDILIPIVYKQIKELGGLRFAVCNSEGSTAIFDDSGSIVFDFQLDSIASFEGNYAIIYEGHKRGVITRSGDIVVEPIFQDVLIKDDQIEVQDFNQWNILTSDNTTKGEFSVENLALFSNQLLHASANGKSWLIDDEGNQVGPEDCQQILSLKGALAAFKKNGKWGVINKNGKEKLPPRFDSLLIDGNIILGKNKGYWALYDSFNIRKTQAVYLQISNGKLLAVKKGRHWGFIDRTGEEVIHVVYDQVGDFKESLVPVAFHGERGIIDKNGEWIVLPHKADSIDILNQSYYITYWKGLKKLKNLDGDLIYFTSNPIEIKRGYLLEHISGGGIWKINFTGQIVEEAQDASYEEVRRPSEGFYAIKKDGSYGFIDSQNRLRVANRYEEVGDFHEGLASIKLLNRWGFINKKEEIIIQPTFQKVSQFQHGVAIAYKGQNGGLINVNGDKISLFSFDSLTAQPNNRFYVYEKGKMGLLSGDGQLMVNPKYDLIQDLNNDFVIVNKGDKYGLVDKNGVNTIPILYDKLIYDESRDTYLCMKKSMPEKVELR